jgi:invasion protein IalB
MRKLSALALMLVIAAPVGAQTAAPAQPAPAAPKAKDPNRIICERQEEIGSRLGGKKICKTAAEWDAERRANREVVDDWQRNPGVGPPSG